MKIRSMVLIIWADFRKRFQRICVKAMPNEAFRLITKAEARILDAVVCMIDDKKSGAYC